MKFVYFLVLLHRALLPGGGTAECTSLIQPDVFTSFRACDLARQSRHYAVPYSGYRTDVHVVYCVSVDEKSAAALYSAFRLPFVARAQQ